MLPYLPAYKTDSELGIGNNCAQLPLVKTSEYVKTKRARMDIFFIIMTVHSSQSFTSPNKSSIIMKFATSLTISALQQKKLSADLFRPHCEFPANC